MSKLGIKVVISYIIITLVSTLMFIFIIRGSMMNILIAEKKDNLLDIATFVVSNINDTIEKAGVNKSKVKSKNDVSFYGKTDKSYDIKIAEKVVKLPLSIFMLQNSKVDIYLLDTKGKILFYYMDNDDSDNKFTYKNEAIFDKEKFYAQKNIYINRVFIGSVLVTVRENNLTDINMQIYSMVYGSFLIIFMITFAIVLIFKVNVLEPMAKLRENISNISLDKDLNWKNINTRDELEDMNKELYDITTKMQSLSEARNEFFQNTSHELKTPLMSIRGYAEAIKDGVLYGKEQQEALDIIIDESDKLASSITSVLYISSLDKHFRNLKNAEMTNIYDEVDELKTRHTFSKIRNEIEIVNNIPKKLYIEVEPEKLNRIISNLFSNALRYAKSKIIFDFSAEYDKIRFFVIDDGKGFENNEEEKVFDRFYKGDDGKNGLGLAIVSSIVKSFDGDIKAYNSENGGAVIEIIVPRKAYIHY